MEGVLVPMNVNTNDEVGVLIKRFDATPSIMRPHNYPYHGEFIEGCGLGKVKDLYGYYYESDGITP
jgi:hypothetical protein